MRPEHWLFTIPLRLRSLFRGVQADQELDDELRDHLERKTEEYVAKGMAPEEARRRARLDMDGIEQTKEKCRDARKVNWIQDFVQDLHYGLRMLRKSPGFTLVAVLSLALGIGANTTTFSIVSAVLLRSLPVHEPDQLVALYGTRPHEGDIAAEHSYPDYLDFLRQTQVFSGVAAFTPVVLGLSGGTEPERSWGALVSGNYFTLLGVRMAQGRSIVPEDDLRPGESPVAVLSYALWRRNFGADPNIVGRQVKLNSNSFTVVGIAPESFRGVDPIASATEIWIPLAMQAQLLQDEALENRTNRDHRWLMLIGRLQPGVSRRQAQSAMDVLTTRLARTYPESNDGRGVRLDPAGAVYPEFRQIVGSFLSILMAVVGLVLLIACANVANLLFGRATARQREIGIRLALGAGRSRVVRQLVTESLLLASLGGIVALILSLWALNLFTRIRIPLLIPIDLHLGLDARIFGFAAAVSALTGISFGLAPALAATGLELTPALKEEGRFAERPGRMQMGRFLVIPQVALSLVLLVSTGLLLKSLRNTQAIDVGFRSDHVLLISLDPSLHGYSVPKAVRLLRQLQERVSRVPGVTSASVTDRVPLSFGANALRIGIPGRDLPREGSFNQVTLFIVAPRYFETMAVALLRGRDFEQDGPPAESEAIINETMARRFWPNLTGQTGAVGERFNAGGKSYEVIAVTKDEKARTLGEDPTPCLFLPMAGNYWPSPFGMTLVVRTEFDPYSAVVPVRKQIEALDRGLALFNIESMDAHVRGAQFLPRLAVSLFGAFGSIGLILATVGLYGVVAYSVRHRTREIGIRMALGATRRDVARMVISQGMAMTAVGIVLGFIGAVFATRFLGGLLYGIRPGDPLTLVGASTILGLVALAACYLPTRRAMRVDPMVALRYE